MAKFAMGSEEWRKHLSAKMKEVHARRKAAGQPHPPTAARQANARRAARDNESTIVITTPPAPSALSTAAAISRTVMLPDPIGTPPRRSQGLKDASIYDVFPILQFIKTLSPTQKAILRDNIAELLDFTV